MRCREGDSHIRMIVKAFNLGMKITTVRTKRSLGRIPVSISSYFANEGRT